MNDYKPRIFIASSVEGLDVAYALQELLDYNAECTVWDQDVFSPSSNTLLDLVNRSQNSDFGIFVFTFDDTARISDTKEYVVRDNVLFELGLFIGTIGLNRCFFVYPRDIEDFHLPTDLMGITPLKYYSKRQDGNIKAALGPVSNQINKTIKKVGAHKIEVNQPLKQQISVAGLNSFFTNRDDYKVYRKDFSTIDKYINTAQKSIVLVGISLSTGIEFDDICSVLKERISSQDDFQITISLLNPYQEELFLSLKSMFGIEHTELQNQTKRALRKLQELKNTLNNHQKNRFTIKMHKTLPFGSAILLDDNLENGTIQIETKPYKVGMRKSFAMEFINNGSDFYKTIRKSYYDLINDGDIYAISE